MLIHELHCGPLSLVLEDGALRSVRSGGQEIVRHLYVAVRDRNWGTVRPHFTEYEVEQRENSFTVRLTAETVQDGIDFVWRGVIEGRAEGKVTYVMQGEARSPFERNRIGFCVLHPDHFAGLPVEVDTSEGTVKGMFPERIAPHQPYVGIRRMRHGAPNAPGIEVEIAFEGDLFEMEDQRNWTDASYKTYCTPLSEPFPVIVGKGDTVEQRVMIRVDGGEAERRRMLGRSCASVRVERRAVGTLPALGLTFTPSAPPPERVKPLRLSFLRAELTLSEDRWP
jgi:hypothetical protein